MKRSVKSIMKQLISAVLIIAGLCVLVYPSGKEWLQTYKQKQLLISLEVLAAEDSYGDNSNGIPKEAIASMKPGGQGGTPAISSDLLQARDDEQKKLAQEKKRLQDEAARNAEGILKIDSIQLKLPVLTGATKKNLNLSVASVERSAKPGQDGNYAIAGHRSYAYGRNFNRLGEIALQDRIEVQTKDALYYYAVTDIFRVKPNETWVLDPTETRTITLITCDPMRNPTYRLIIRGVLVESSRL